MIDEPEYTDTPYADRVDGLSPLFVVSSGEPDENNQVGVYVDVADIRLARQFFPLSELEAPAEPGPDGWSRLAAWLSRVISESLTSYGENQCADCGAVMDGDSHLRTQHARDCEFVGLNGDPWRPDNI